MKICGSLGWGGGGGMQKQIRQLHFLLCDLYWKVSVKPMVYPLRSFLLQVPLFCAQITESVIQRHYQILA